jgi:hypothetical protein
LAIRKNSELKTGWQVNLSFPICLHIKDIELLESFSVFFGVGLVNTHGSTASFKVQSIKDLQIIVNHFINYPLKSQKGADFLLFQKAPPPGRSSTGRPVIQVKGKG